MRRKLARPGDVICYRFRNELRRGIVIKKSSEYLEVKLDKPRGLEDWEEVLFGHIHPDPMKDNVYYHSEYTIEEPTNG